MLETPGPQSERKYYPQQKRESTRFGNRAARACSTTGGLAEARSPYGVIGVVDAAIEIAIGRKAPAGLSLGFAPDDVVADVYGAVVIEVAGDRRRVAPRERWQLVQRDDPIVV